MTVNKNCIIRLSKYKNALTKLKALGFVKVFSDNLADAAGVASSLVRKDFSIFGITGNKKGGYSVEELIEKLNDILGKSDIQKVVIAGAGNIGSALMKYAGFEKEGLKVSAVFDNDPSKTDGKGAVPVLSIDSMKEYIKQNKIKIGIICVPDVSAPGIFESMVASGIKGVLNFAPVSLKTQEDIVVENVNLVGELESLIYFVNALKKIKR
ncbi:MAG: redox-sensing transcriptional repressor Rex [Candidatus Margulisiibacteriota bacterium]